MAAPATIPAMEAATPTKLAYFDDMWMLESTATLLSHLQVTISSPHTNPSRNPNPNSLPSGTQICESKVEDGRQALILNSTIFHPQGGGQPADIGSISIARSGLKFVVEDVRLKDGLVLHYGVFEGSQDGSESKFEEGQEVSLQVDAEKRNLHSRLHSAGHLLDICMHNVGLTHLEPGKGYHFSDGPFVKYKGTIPQDQLQTKAKELEEEACALISKGGKVLVSVLPYDEASIWCGGGLPPYISKSCTPRVVKLGDNLGCPCGGTHVGDIADIKNLKVAQIRVKKGFTKVSYDISP